MKHELCQIRIQIRNVQSPIWRQILVPSSMKLTELHRILQYTMGWENKHSYRFEARSTELPSRSLANAPIGKVFAMIEGPLIYLYDPGDGWEHEITLEERVLCDVEPDHATCMAGERACPPEDCGGAPGYEDVLQALQKPKSRRYAELRAWIGPNFDPLAFSVDEVNRKLVKLFHQR